MQVQKLIGIDHDLMQFYPKHANSYTQHEKAGLDDEDLWIKPFELVLRSHPENQKKHKGEALAVPDIGHLTEGGLIVSVKAVELIGDYLRKFGDLYEIIVDGECWFAYNITNILESVVDKKSSRSDSMGDITVPAYFKEKLPTESQIFKLEETDLLTIYFNVPDNEVDTIFSLGEKHGLNIGVTPVDWKS